jgi:hypothetical protein
MTDLFASEPSAPGGAPPESTSQPSDVAGTLAELERKLRELERELTSIGRRDTPVPDLASPPVEASPQSPPSHSFQPPPRQPAPSEPVAPASSPFQPASPQPASPQSAAPQSAPPQPGGRLVDEATEQRGEVFDRVRPSEAQLTSLAELRRFRDRLERFARELAAEYDALLGRVMTGLSSAPARPAPGPPAPAATPTSTTASPTAASTSAPSASTPPATSTQHSPAAAAEMATAEARENVLFEGRVELGVGPFYDIASLGAFERRLANLPGVSEAAVRRFEASHAVVDVRLATPVALVRELRRASGSDFSVREVASGRILLTFDES